MTDDIQTGVLATYINVPSTEQVSPHQALHHPGLNSNSKIDKNVQNSRELTSAERNRPDIGGMCIHEEHYASIRGMCKSQP